MPVTTNAAGLAGSLRAAADTLAGGLGVEADMAAAMLAAVRAPRRTGAYAATIKAATDPPLSGLSAGGGRVSYAPALEFGTRHMRGQHVLTAAVTRTRSAWLEIAAGGVTTILDHI